MAHKLYALHETTLWKSDYIKHEKAACLLPTYLPAANLPVCLPACLPVCNYLPACLLACLVTELLAFCKSYVP